MGWTPNSVRATVALMHPELAAITDRLIHVEPDTYVATVTENLPLYLSGAFEKMYLKVITGPNTIRVSWEWAHPGGGYNGKTLSFANVNPNDNLLANELLDCANAVEDPDSQLASLLRRAAVEVQKC